MKFRQANFAEVIGPCLRSGIPEFEAIARKEIARRTKGMTTEKERAAALEVSERVWFNWLQAGLVEGLGRGPGRPPKPKKDEE